MTGYLTIIAIICLLAFIINFPITTISLVIVAGLVYLGIYQRTINKIISIKPKKPILFTLIGILILISGCSTQPSTPNSVADEQVEQTDSSEEVNESSETPADSENETSDHDEINDSDSDSKSGFVAATVTRIVDGDTIEVNINGKTEDVRLLLVDTPETKHPDLPVQQFGPEASKFAKDTLSGQKVRLEYDGPERDKYGRILAYLWIGDKTFNQMLLEQGLARLAYIFDPPYTHMDAFTQAENEAKSAKLGIWSVPGYVTDEGFVHQEHQPTTQDTPAQTEPQQAESSLRYDPFGPDRDCGDFNSQQEAQEFYEAAGGPAQDPHRLDGNDNDGFVCESL